MLDVSEAVGKARTYLSVIMPEFAELRPQVEEMELSPDNSMWNITFSAPIGGHKTESVADLFTPRYTWKVVALSTNDGSLIAVTNPSR